MALTDEYTFKLGDTGVVLNADDTTSTFVDISKISGLDSAPPRSTERDHEGADGGFMDAEFEKGRPIALEGTVYAVNTELQPYLDKLKANWAVSRTLVPLYFKTPGVTERVLFVKPLGCRYDFEQAARLDQADIQFQAFAEDPRVYDSTLVSVNIYQGEQVTNGRSYPRSYPYGYGATTSIVGTNLTVDGNRPTPPVYTMTGPIDRPRIVNETTGESMFFDISLSATDSLVVDVKNRTVLLNGQNRRSVLRYANWLFLQPGLNFIRYRADTFNVSNGPQLNATSTFDTDVAPWTGSGGAITIDATKYHLAPQSLLLSPDGASATAETTSEFVPVESGSLYKAEAWVNCAVTRGVLIKIFWYDATNTVISSDQSNLSVTANTWTYHHIEAKAPTNAVKAKMNIAMGSNPAASNLLNIDEAKIFGQFPSILNAQYRAAWR